MKNYNKHNIFAEKNMEATYSLKSSELNIDFINAIRKIFKNNEVEITISTTNNKKGEIEFLKAVSDVRLRKNIISFSVEDFKKNSKKIIAS